MSSSPYAYVGGPARIQVKAARTKEAANASLDFAVSLNRAASHTVSVDYATADNTAIAGADYTAVSGTLTFAKGETAKTISVPVLDDAEDEGAETMYLRLSNPRGAILWRTFEETVGTIDNTDAMPRAWLARFGRAATDQTMEAVSRRVNEGPRESHLELGGGIGGQRLFDRGTSMTDGAMFDSSSYMLGKPGLHDLLRGTSFGFCYWQNILSRFWSPRMSHMWDIL